MEKNHPVIKAIIADDESLARDVIRKYLSGFPQVEIIAECANGLETLNQVKALEPDLLFLDIQMPELDGLSLLGELNRLPMIIFTTAYNQYAIKAFEINAVDYLLKPFDRERFLQAVNKAIVHQESPARLEKKINALQLSLDELIKTGKQFTSRILIKGNDVYSFLQVADITWFEACSNYVKIHTRERTYLKNTSLNELEARLNPQAFIRIHRSTIVNATFIKEMKPYFNGEYYIYLTNGEKLKLSRSYKDRIKLIIDESI